MDDKQVAAPLPEPTEHRAILIVNQATAGCICGWGVGRSYRWHQAYAHVKQATCIHQFKTAPPTIHKPHCDLCGTYGEVSPLPEIASEETGTHVCGGKTRSWPEVLCSLCPQIPATSSPVPLGAGAKTFEEWWEPFRDKLPKTTDILRNASFCQVAEYFWNAALASKAVPIQSGITEADGEAWRAVVEWGSLQNDTARAINELASSYVYFRDELASLKKLYDSVDAENIDLRVKLRTLEAVPVGEGDLPKPTREDWDNSARLLAAKAPRGDGDHYDLARIECYSRELLQSSQRERELQQTIGEISTALGCSESPDPVRTAKTCYTQWTRRIKEVAELEATVARLRSQEGAR